MTIRTILLILALAATVVAVQTPCSAELRFGPWVFWAPYYYPSPEKMKNLGLKPEDFAPRYQAPNPLPPPSDGYCPPPPPRPRKVAAKSRLKRELSGPVVEPRRTRTYDRSFRVPTSRSTESRPVRPVTVRQSQPAAPAPPPIHNTRFRFGAQDKPKPVRSAPGAIR